MLLADSVILIRYHCRYKRDLHGKPLYRKILHWKPLGLLARFTRLLAKFTRNHYVY